MGLLGKAEDVLVTSTAALVAAEKLVVVEVTMVVVVVAVVLVVVVDSPDGIRQPKKHVRMSMVELGHVPPQLSGSVTVRVRVETPFPHVTEHADHDDQALSWQLAGQHVPPHASVSLSEPRHEPPQLADAVTVRVRDR